MEILRLFDMPIIHDTITADVGVSIGMAMQEPGRHLWPLLAQAEEACWQAKRNGRGRASLYESDWEAT
jgi:PleD family two-component response regulator